MLKNYLKISLRNFFKHKVYSVINVTGLSIGMACCILIMLYVQNELSYDKHHQKAGQIYRVAGDLVFGGNHFQLAVAPAPMAEALVRDFPEVTKAVRFRDQGSFLVKKTNDTQNLKEERVVFADKEVFEIFTIPLTDGDAASALKKPNSVVISQTKAIKYFADQNPVGESLRRYCDCREWQPESRPG